NGLLLLGSLAKPFSRSSLLDLLAAETSKVSSPGTSSPESPQINTNVRQLADALHSKSLIAHFQPKISCANGELLGFECLARWPQKDGSITPPDMFIGLAEETGLIHELSKQVYDYALASLASRAQKSRLKLALNLSLHNLNDTTFPNWLLDKCQRHSIEPEQIILEVTETASMNNPLAILENLTQFRIRGFHLSIDDFGVGYSSLVQLARLPFSELKIDQMFVKTLANSEESQKIVKSVVSLGNSMGLNVVAEGVEDLWALEFLHHIGCNEAQGYFIARPMDNLAATAWDGFSWNNEA
ncbi:MAG: EAL domain-containing protein, partial [Pseudomonadales bacterium]